MKKKILIIYDDFAPMNNCAAIPNTKVVKYLSRKDLDITVITKEVPEEMPVDENLISDEIRALRIIRVNNSVLYRKTLGAYRRRITDNGIKLKMKAETRPLKAAAVSFLKNTFFYLRRKDWYHCAVRTAAKALKKERFDCIYSSYPDLDAHWLAETLLKKGFSDKWIADFRDPMYYEHHDEHGVGKKKKEQHRIERKANHITVVSEGAIEKFVFPDIPRDKITYIPNGYDPEDFDFKPCENANNVNRFRIFYAGTLYAGKRDFSVLFRALSELAQEGTVELDKVTVEYAGNEWPIMQSFAEKYDLKSCCYNWGYVTRTQVLDILEEVDFGSVCSHNTKSDKGVVTGKVFELLLVRKPIIAVVNGDEPESELGRIVRKCNAGIVYEEATHEKDYFLFKEWLRQTYLEKMQSGKVASHLITMERDKYSYETIADNLFDLMK